MAYTINLSPFSILHLITSLLTKNEKNRNTAKPTRLSTKYR